MRFRQPIEAGRLSALASTPEKSSYGASQSRSCSEEPLAGVGEWPDAICVRALRDAGRCANSLAETADGQRPQRRAYQTVPVPHASPPSTRNTAAYA
jgi:hypothetical protein